MRGFLLARRLVASSVFAGTAGGLLLWAVPKYNAHRNKQGSTFAGVLAEDKRSEFVMCKNLPSRAEQHQSLRDDTFDVLVIGGGATGCGVALDSTSRGLKTALIEKYDFSSGTSSRSTKLLHGGVRYLQKAIMGLDIEQYRMVKEALAERANLIDIAPHLAYALPIMLPVYKYWQIPYYWVGIKAYDVVAGRQLLEPSYLLSKRKALEFFPMLKKDKLKGAIVYYDGQHEDARMCLAIALTAARLGATITNHTEVLHLIKSTDAQGQQVCSGARLRDRCSGEEWDVKAKCVVNATGPYTDFVRTLDKPAGGKICQPSSGVHIILPQYYSPAKMGLLDPSTSDGRVIFFLPWQNQTIAGTTDVPCPLSDDPAPSEKEIDFILGEIKNYLSSDVHVRRGDVQSAWSGIRPLVLNPNAKDTQSLARNHIIEVSDSNLITIAGGKWTTYRSMAEETMDKAIEVCHLEPQHPCRTTGLVLDGGQNYTPTMFIRLIQDFGLDREVAKHLTTTYGDRAFKVAKMAKATGKRWPIVGKRLHEEFPYIEAEVEYAVKEYAWTAVDVLARRTRLAFLSTEAAEQALPKVIEIMAQHLNWPEHRQKVEYERAMEFLRVQMGRDLNVESQNVPINFTKDEINDYIRQYRTLDPDNKGYVPMHDLRKYFKECGESVPEESLRRILGQVQLSKHAQLDLGEFLQVMSALKTGAESSQKYKRTSITEEEFAAPISTARSGGGV